MAQEVRKVIHYLTTELKYDYDSDNMSTLITDIRNETDTKNRKKTPCG